MAFGTLSYDPFWMPGELPDVGEPLIPAGRFSVGTKAGNKLFGTGGFGALAREDQ